MISLKKIFEVVLVEVDPMQSSLPPIPAQQGAQQTGNQEENIVTYPKDSFSISLFPDKKKMLFSPLKGSIPPKKPRMIVNQLKNNFNIYTVKDLQGGILEVTLNPSEDFFKVVDFIKNWMDEYKG